MNRIIKNVLLASLMLVSAVICSFGQDYDEQRFSGKQGDAWLGGSFNFSSFGVGGGDVRLNILTLTPQARFFPSKYLCVSPLFSWTGMFIDDYSGSMVNLGGEIGFLYGGKSAKKAMPYFLVSPNALIIGSHYSDGDFSDSESDGVFMLPFSFGLMVPFGNSGIGMQFQIGYDFGFNEGDNMNIFSVGIGICGFGKKTAISVLNVNRLTNSYIY